ncbi:MAG TPA: phospho-sugar mutase [Acidimicrobiia bacterium]
MSDLLRRAAEWAAGDPDPETRSEVEALIEAEDEAALAELFGEPLTFGTAGIRGRVGPGPTRMNRATVIRTTAGLASYLGDTAGRPVVVAFDARPTSPIFARDTAGVLVAAGIPVVFFPTPTPTPLAAFTAKVTGAAAAVVITASHNPPQDNGYKVYGENAAQIIPPVDQEIASRIDAAPRAGEVPRLEEPWSSVLFEMAPDDIFDRYQAEVTAVRPWQVESDLSIVYTPVHGCGGETVSALLAGAGHRGLVPVAEQFAPDGTFPTVTFPNPEEPGVLDLALATASRVGADLVIANDPDADRLAAAAPREGEWRTFTGNELGVLLGDYILGSGGVERPIVVSSIVSSPMMAALAEARGARHVSTLTGFKWIVNAGLHLEQAGEGRFVFGYEEALGYTVGSVVRDKDGMSAALILCDLAETLRRRGATLWDRLAELWKELGVWVSTQVSVTREGPDGMSELRAAVASLAADPPTEVAGFEVTSVTDYRVGVGDRPFWLGEQDLVELVFGSRGRALARPSGTEPKLKIYVDLRGEAGDDPFRAQADLGEEAGSVARSLAERVTG